MRFIFTIEYGLSQQIKKVTITEFGTYIVHEVINNLGIIKVVALLWFQ